MAQDLPPQGGYEPVQYKVFPFLANGFYSANLLPSAISPLAASVLATTSSACSPSWATAGINISKVSGN